MECNGCGASNSNNRLTCEFCGNALVKFNSAEKEIDAVAELIQSAQKIAQEHAQNPGKRCREIGAFWSTSFTPRSPDACTDILLQIINAIDPDSSGLRCEDNQQLVSRGETILLSLKMMDGANQSKVSTLEVLFQKKVDEMNKNEAQHMMLVYVVCGGVLLAAIYSIAF